ncbi:hypothetical protein [Pedobacter caeni]|uniref:Uncharacterized protein n=1 Tax=Pedobacter caeni TaxID=288992 RepID=A0A1M4VG66_9SPHI|nr:hypothetical protein [Pedobacter caeni]SHE67860.1 hypothetical protein SAMN04488522_101895 [Pedobacter caeni]
MTERQKYQGTFADQFGTTDIVVLNDFENLYFEIDGVKFEGLEKTNNINE